MLKHLLIVITLLITLNFTAQPVWAASPTPTSHKRFISLWQKITLRNLLKYQITVTPGIASATPTLTPTSSPTPKVQQPQPTTATPSKTPTPTLKTASPTPVKPTPTKSQTATPTIAHAITPAIGINEVTTYIMKEINNYRASQGLSAVTTSAETCDFAKIRAQEIATNFNHDGFNERKLNKTLPYAHWSSITENIAMTSDYKQVVPMWINSSGHAANMRANTPYVCVIQHGNYYAYEGMRP